MTEHFSKEEFEKILEDLERPNFLKELNEELEYLDEKYAKLEIEINKQLAKWEEFEIEIKQLAKPEEFERDLQGFALKNKHIEFDEPSEMLKEKFPLPYQLDFINFAKTLRKELVDVFSEVKSSVSFTGFFRRVRIKRKHWRGRPTYFENGFKVSKQSGYIKRSVARQLRQTTVELIEPYPKTLERLRMSMTKTKKGQLHNVELIKTDKLVGDIALGLAFKQYAEKLLSEEMSNNQIDAWDLYIMSDAPEQITQEYYDGSLMCFIELPMNVKEFIARNWERYEKANYKTKMMMRGRYITNEMLEETGLTIDQAVEKMFGGRTKDNNDYSNTWGASPWPLGGGEPKRKRGRPRKHP